MAIKKPHDALCFLDFATAVARSNELSVLYGRCMSNWLNKLYYICTTPLIDVVDGYRFNSST